MCSMFILAGRVRGLVMVFCSVLLIGGCLSSSGGEDSTSISVQRWNRIANDAGALDHTPLQVGEVHTFGHQLGPGRSRRALAIVHIAMFDAIIAISGGYKSYTSLSAAPLGTSMQAAVAQAAHDTLVALYTSHSQTFGQRLAEDLQGIVDTTARSKGVLLGQQAAAAILAQRANDGANLPVTYTPGVEAG